MSLSDSATVLVIVFEKSLNGHNTANFEATTSIFCMVIDIDETYKMILKLQPRSKFNVQDDDDDVTFS